MIKFLFPRLAVLFLATGPLVNSEAADFTLTSQSTTVVPSTRGGANATHFGWDSFGAISDPIDDTTPDINETTTGVRFRTVAGGDHTSGSGNYYSYSDTPDEEVTVVTNGTPGVSGKTTIIAQIVTLFGGFPAPWVLGEINGVEPTELIQGSNAAGKGQLWVMWEIPGNAETYQFTLKGTPGVSAYSFDKIEIDTWYDADGESHPDSMILSEAAAIAHIMDQASGPVVPSSRGGRGTTSFGWDTFGPAGGPAAVINDNTPDIGSDPTGLARFQTMNGEVHQLAGGGNLYLLSFVPGANLTLDEQITVPTDGVPGPAGFTTLILQLVSASSGQGGTTFANDIFLGPIEGVAPVVVQGSGATSAMLWAKWVIPGNKATYTIDIDGVPNQQHYSFDQVVVDTKYSRYEGVGDTMKAQTVEITTTTLADVVKGTPVSVQLQANGGAAPFAWALADGSTLPTGLTLSNSGLISGTPSVLGATTFTVEVTEGGGYQDAQELTLTVVSRLEIVTAATLPTAVVGRAYEVVLTAAEGAAPYTWEEVTTTLPAGLSLSDAGVISGTPQVAGEATVTLQVTDDDGAQMERTFLLPISATLQTPVMNPLPVYTTVVGAEISGYQLTALNYPAGFEVSGLPKGLKLTATTGEITGRVATAGVYSIQVRAFNAAGSSSWITALLVVKALPAGQFGSFTGWSERDVINGSLGSLITLKTTPTGSFTLSVKTGSASKSARGFLNGSAPQVQAEVAGGMLSLSIDPTTGAVSGNHAGAEVNGWRAAWDKNLNPASGREGFYSVAMELDANHTGDNMVPKGVGFATFAVPATGLLRVTGKTADGQNIISSGPMGPNGEIAIYAPQHANKGSLLGQWELAEDGDGVFSDNEVSGELTWQKPATKGRVHAGAFGPLTLNVTGRYLAQSAKGQTVLGLPDRGEFELEFSEGGIGESATVADVSGIEWTEKFTALMPAAGNAARASVKINKSTGAMSGAFTLTETTPSLVRKNVKFFGQVVRTADAEARAVGYFLLPQIPIGGQKANATPMLSGAVYAVQPPLP